MYKNYLLFQKNYYNTLMDMSVFFVVEPIHPKWSELFSWNIFMYSLIITFFIIAIFCIIKYLQKILQKNVITKKQENFYHFPNPDDEKFLEKIFFILQKFVSEKYLPKNAVSHSFFDIAKYCNNKNILKEYKNLEEKIFNNVLLTENEKIEILHSIQKIIHTES